MKTAAALGLVAMLMAGTATAQTAEATAPASSEASQALGDLSGNWAVFWAWFTEERAVISFSGAMDIKSAGEGRWDIALANHVLDTEEDQPLLVNARQQCEGVEQGDTLVVTCQVTQASAADYTPDIFSLVRTSPTRLSGTLREVGGSDLEGLEAHFVR